MADDSGETQTGTRLDKPPSRDDNSAHEKQTGSDDELHKLTARKFRDKLNSEDSSSNSRHLHDDDLAGEDKGRRQDLSVKGIVRSPLSQSVREGRPVGPFCKTKEWYSMDSGQSDMLDKTRRNLPLGGSIKRKLRRKPTKRFDKVEETYGINTEEYEQIRGRVLQERAVVNAIEALQERWRMIMYMYHDCVDLNEGRKDRNQKRLTVKRQLELIFIITMFAVMCIPITVIMVALCR